jgi:polysaccharide biosynthesis/export protein
LAALLLTGCGGTFFPKGGPDPELTYTQAVAVSTEEGSTRLPYLVIDVTPDVASALARIDEFGPSLRLHGGRPQLRLGIGDVVSITIYESGPGGLFTSAASAGGAAALPAQTISSAGTITVPYAGVVQAAGRTVTELERRIEAALKDKAIEPQVIVNVQDQRSNQVSVLGQVTVPGQIPLLPGGIRLLDAIARAGGTRIPGHESQVTVQRGSRPPTTVSFNRLVTHPNENIYLAPGDVVYVWRQPRFFVALGANGRNSRQEFDAETLSLTAAMGMASGLLDNQANPAAVFVYRLERREFLEPLGYPVQNFVTGVVPTVYTVNLHTSGGVFLASQFRMRPHDVLYVANAPAVEIKKFVDLLSTISGIGANTAAIYGIVKGNATVATPPVTSTPAAAPASQ